MLELNLTPVFKARGIDKPYTFLVKAGFSAHTASLVLSGKLRTVKLAHIELICRVLVCEPHDLLIWTPDKNLVYASDHPLFNLTQKETVPNIKKTLATLPFKQLKEMTSAMVNGEL